MWPICLTHERPYLYDALCFLFITKEKDILFHSIVGVLVWFHMKTIIGVLLTNFISTWFLNHFVWFGTWVAIAFGSLNLASNLLIITTLNQSRWQRCFLCIIYEYVTNVCSNSESSRSLLPSTNLWYPISADIGPKCSSAENRYDSVTRFGVCADLMAILTGWKSTVEINLLQVIAQASNVSSVGERVVMDILDICEGPTHLKYILITFSHQWICCKIERQEYSGYRNHSQESHSQMSIARW